MSTKKKVYDYEQSQNVISEAWKLAIKHLENTLGDQYKCNVTENALPKFFDYVQQDIKYLKECPKCGEIDEEGNFCMIKISHDSDRRHEVCYDCYKQSDEYEEDNE